MRFFYQNPILKVAFLAGMFACLPGGFAQTTNAVGSQQVYIVQAGDTLLKIAEHFGIALKSLGQANRLQSTRIVVGQKLVIPPADESVALTNEIPTPAPAPPAGRKAITFIDPELQALVEYAQKSWNTGGTNPADIVKNVKGFENLRAMHQGEKTEAVAQILMAEEAFFYGALGDSGTGSKLLHQLAADYPDTNLGKDIGQIVKTEEDEGEPTPASLLGNPWTVPVNGGVTLSLIRSFDLSNDCVLAPFTGLEQTNLVIAVPGLSRTNEHTGAFAKDVLYQSGSLYRHGLPCISGDGTRLLKLVNSTTIQLLDAFTHKTVGAPLTHAMPISVGKFSPDNQLLATAAGGVVHLWKTQDGRPFGDHVTQKQDVATLFFSGDSSRLCIAASNSEVTVWDVRTGRQVGNPFKCADEGWREAHQGTGEWTVFSPDGRILLDGPDSYWLWDVETGMRSRQAIDPDDKIFDIVFSPDSKRVVTTDGAAERSAQVWDAKTGLPVTKPLRHRHSVFTAEFLPDGRRFVTTSLDGNARIWDSISGKLLVLCVHPDAEVPVAAISPNGLFLATAGGKTARIWSTATGELMAKPIESPAKVTGAKFSADSKALLTVTDSQVVQIWQIEN